MNWKDSEEMRRLFRVSEDNLLVMELFSALLQERARFFTPEEVSAFAADCGLSGEEAFRTLLAAACGLKSDENPRHRLLKEKYLDAAVRPLDPEIYRQDPFYRTVRLPEKKLNRWEMTHQVYAPYEVFCYDDPLVTPEGREIPPIGYFTEAFAYPAVLEGGRLWMAVTPNEVETMRRDIGAAHGKIAVFGLGLGYYAFMTARMEKVSSVTVVERDPDVIALFRECLLPQFPHREKIRVVQRDAYDYLRQDMPREDFDFAYVDIWHDVLDGTPLYLKARQMEVYSPRTEFAYWVEKSMLMWLRGLMIEEIKMGKGKLFDLLTARARTPEACLALLSLESIRKMAPAIPADAVLP